VSADKNGKVDRAAAGTKSTGRTAGDVPALPEVPPDRPSDLQITRPFPAKDGIKRQPSIEEISSSLLLADSSNEQPAAPLEELSGSVLLDDAPDRAGPAVLSRPPPPSAGRPRPSVKPPIPRSLSGRLSDAANRALLGLSAPVESAAVQSAPPHTAPVTESNVPLPDATSPDPVPPSESTSPDALPPLASMTGDVEVTRLPRGRFEPLLDAVRSALQKAHALVIEHRALQVERRPVWFLPVVAVGGLIVGIGLLALVGSAVHGCGDSATPPRDETAITQPSSQALPPPMAPPPTPTPTPLALVPPTPAPSLLACTVAGEPHTMAPSATVTAGVEVVRLGDDLALGFAPSDHEAIGVRLDASSLGATSTVKAHSRDVVRRVTPLANARGTLSVAADTDRGDDPLHGRRTVLADPALQFGDSGAHLAWAQVGGAHAAALWPLDEGGDVESLRGAAENTGERTIALAFRHGGAVWTGVVTGGSHLAPKGELARIDGLGAAVGSPAIALSGGSVLVAWSDRPSVDEPWRLRWTRFDAGDTPSAPETFSPPAGGKGQQAMSPSLTALAGNRFLLVWTEGPASGHDVRALTLGPDGKAVGTPLVLSNAGVNAGQAQAAVTRGGQGVVAFLESGGDGYEVVATPIACGE